jgi:dTMP kinase
MAFLVIEGLDGSGKSTQINLLRNHFNKQGLKYKYLHFPRNDSGLFGELIAMFLRGELGKIGDVNPYLAAMIYAADRFDARVEMIGWLAEGNLLLVDRYVISNIAFQCAKLDSTIKKGELRKWIYQLEYTNYGIPRPDLNIFLDVPFGFTTEKLSSKRSGNERDYLKGGQDIHEADLNFQKRVRQEYLEQSKTDKSLKVLSCFDNNNMILSPDEIFCRITKLIRNENIPGLQNT